MFKNPYVQSVASAVATGVGISFLILLFSYAVHARHSTKPASNLSASVSNALFGDPAGINEEEPLGIPTAVISQTDTSARRKHKTIGAEAYVVRDVASSTVLYKNNNERLLPVASLTKLVTAVVAERLLGANGRVTMTASSLSTEGNTGQFRSDEKFSVAEIIHPLFMVSSNDAAEALARSYKPGRTMFIKAMNDWAYSIGAYHTYFADPSGLSAKNISSADDMSVILEWIFKNKPEFVEILRMKSYALHTHVWVNKTHFLNLSSYVAGKNGYIPEAKETSTGLFSVRDRMYSITVLGTKNRDQDVLELLSWITDSGKI